MKPFKLKSIEDRLIAIRLIRKGDVYGRDDKLSYEAEEPLIEFFDASYRFPESALIKDQADMPGCYSGDRCIVSTIFKKELSNGAKLSTPWPLFMSKENVKSICEWLLSELTEEEIKNSGIEFHPDFYEKNNTENCTMKESTNFFSDADIFDFDRGYPEDKLLEYTNRNKYLSTNLELTNKLIDDIHLLEQYVAESEARLNIIKSKKRILMARQFFEKQIDDHKDYFIEREIAKHKIEN